MQFWANTFTEMIEALQGSKMPLLKYCIQYMVRDFSYLCGTYYVRFNAEAAMAKVRVSLVRV